MSARPWLELDAELAALVDAPHPGLVACIESGLPLACALRAQDAYERTTGLAAGDIVLLAGCWGSNALQAHGEDGAAAVLCMEHVAPSEHGLGLAEHQAACWLVHELAHVARYATPGSGSLVALLPVDGDLRDGLDALPPAERLVDEGLASALQLEAFPGLAPWQALHFDEASHRGVLSRASRFLFALPRMDAAAASEMLYAGSAADSRWGYAVGAEMGRLARTTGARWAELLPASTAEVLALAAEASDGEWRPALTALARGALDGSLTSRPAAARPRPCG